MNLFFTPQVGKEICKLEKNNSYSNIRTFFYELISERSSNNSWKMGTYINGNIQKPFLKIRMGGSSGYRINCLLLIVDDKVIISAVHPKTGSSGQSNLGPNAIKDAYREAIETCKSPDIVPVKLDAQ